MCWAWNRSESWPTMALWEDFVRENIWHSLKTIISINCIHYFKIVGNTLTEIEGKEKMTCCTTLYISHFKLNYFKLKLQLQWRSNKTRSYMQIMIESSFLSVLYFCNTIIKVIFQNGTYLWFIFCLFPPSLHLLHQM